MPSIIPLLMEPACLKLVRAVMSAATAARLRRAAIQTYKRMEP